MKRFSPAPVDTLQNPVKSGFMMTCWQNGARVMMHSSEVAKLMKKKERVEQEARSSLSEESPASASARPGASRVDARNKGACEDKEKAKFSSDLTPPPIVPRARKLAENASWQFLAKEMLRVAGHPKHCHKPACRRAKRCIGGKDACYLREFETVDLVMQERVLAPLRDSVVRR